MGAYWSSNGYRLHPGITENLLAISGNPGSRIKALNTLQFSPIQITAILYLTFGNLDKIPNQVWAPVTTTNDSNLDHFPILGPFLL
jgi:hypothetical protein